MSETIKTIKIVSSDKKSQGDFIEINESDFNPKEHTKYEDDGKPAKNAGGKKGKAAAEDEDI